MIIHLKIISMSAIVSKFGQLGCVEGGDEDDNYIYSELSIDGKGFTTMLDKTTGKRYFRADSRLAQFHGYASMGEALADDDVMDLYLKMEKEQGYWVLKN